MTSMRLAAGAIAAVLALSACAPTYDQETQQSFRRQVVAVSKASAAGDWQGAVTQLDVLSEELTAARADGKVDEERFNQIVTAMDLVRMDLQAAITAAAHEAERQRLQEQQAQLEQQLQDVQSQLQQQLDQLQHQSSGSGGDDESDGDGPKDKGGKGPKDKGDKGKGKDGKGEKD
ncbi:hypothetical protein [Agromyces sp. Marseille-P2726]|uniref:hypothetical protein n=1 Tax=Agromyces sp. Marseille-P2726 TaxID=2709132 RepID=UPI00156F414F|nr:hypothetical protein [Agromyces sp. Marseille-P2726]